MGLVAGSPGEYTLGSLNDSTGWIALFDATEDVNVTIRGTFVGTIAVQLSDQPDATKTRYTQLSDTYTAAQPPFALPKLLGGWFRLIMTAYTSGTAYIGVGANRSDAGTSVRLSPQMQSNAPIGDSFS